MSPDKQRRTFLSYSRINKDFALRLAKELKSAGFNVWIDQMDIPTGARWDDELEKALEECEIFMVILTPASSASDNVKDEIGYAIDTDKRILPILLENAKVPLRLRRFQYVDFTGKTYDEGMEGAKQQLKKLIDEPITLLDPPSAEELALGAEKDRLRRENLAARKAESVRKAKETAAPEIAPASIGFEKPTPVAPPPAKIEPVSQPAPAIVQSVPQSAPNMAASVPAPSQAIQKKGLSKPLMIGLGIGALAMMAICVVAGIGLLTSGGDPPSYVDPVEPPPVATEVVFTEEPGSIPNTGGEPACSFDGSQPVNVYVENPSSHNLDYYWIDYDCQEEYYGTLSAGDSVTLSTYVTHYWIFLDNQTGENYFEYVADGGDYVAIPDDSATKEINGFTVTNVYYDGGEFIQISSQEWLETFYEDGTQYHFGENNRDEWSVYLYDESRDVYVHLDLWTKEILLDDNTGQGEFVLYNIVESTTEVKGFNVWHVYYDGGEFNQTGDYEWTEYNSGEEYPYVENGRDEWSVYLYNEPGNTYVHLDLWTGEVYVDQNNGEGEYYFADILGAE